MSRAAAMRTVRELIADGAIIAIQDGNHGGSHPKASEYVPDGVPFVMASDISNGFVDLAGCKKLPKSRTDRLRIGFARNGDVLLTHKGTVGEVAVLADIEEYVMLTPQVTYYRCDPNKLEPRYLAFAFRSDAFQAQLSSISSQSTRPYVSISTQRHLQIPWVPIDGQRRIAAILGAYDDLIEVNRRRVAVLEEMARGLFEEWFVRFRFPGHEEVPIVDTPDGPLPQGWSFQRIEDAFDFLGGGTPSKTVEEYWIEGTVDWYTPTDLTGSGSLFMDRSGLRITEMGLAKSSAKLFPANSIMMTSRATLGVIAICTGPATTNQGFITCIPNKRLPRTYLYQLLRQNVPVFIAHATGATFKEITKGVFKKLKVCVPCQDVVERFEEIASPMHDMILALERSNRSLASSRDLLLPCLISGQLSVEAAERELENAA